MTPGISLVATQTLSIGNTTTREVTLSSNTAFATYIGVRWDGDKVRGIRVDLSDGTSQKAGGFDDGGYTLTEYRFAAGETLTKAWLRDSGYGYGSVRQIEFATSKSTAEALRAGPGGFDHEVSLAVEGSFLVGFRAWVNPDNFLNGLAFMVRAAAPKPLVYRPTFETAAAGNAAAAKTQVTCASETSVAHALYVRSDGDKVRGLRLDFADGTSQKAGGFDDVDYHLDSYTFAQDEALASLTLTTSGYGYGSLRRIEFTTNKGGNFGAGPGGVDEIVSPPAAGASLAGFHAWVNQDNFINALAFRLTNDSPYRIALQNSSGLNCAYANGVVTVNGIAAIRISDEGGNKHGLVTAHNRVLGISSGNVTGYCAFDGPAVLTISLFADATFEAKFKTGEGDGSVYGAIAGVAAPTDKPALISALVRKYAPVFMLNADEVYWPSDIDSFLGNMILQKVDGESPSDFYTGPMNRNVLAAQAVLLGDHNSNTGACLRTRNDLNLPSDTQDWFNGTRPADSSHVTSYAVVTEGSNRKLNIVYWWFFNYNQGKNVANTSWGNHVSDWEHARVELGNVDFTNPGKETILGVMYDHHGDQETHAPGDGVAEFCGRQVILHMANGDHEIYPKTGVYDRPQNTHDYVRNNGYSYDQRAGKIEMYLWNGSDFLPAPSPAFQDPAWIRYRGRWGNWERGSLFGQVARLESGPEGMFRAGEYPVPR